MWKCVWCECGWSINQFLIETKFFASVFLDSFMCYHYTSTDVRPHMSRKSNLMKPLTLNWERKHSMSGLYTYISFHPTPNPPHPHPHPHPPPPPTHHPPPTPPPTTPTHHPHPHPPPTPTPPPHVFHVFGEDRGTCVWAKGIPSKSTNSNDTEGQNSFQKTWGLWNRSPGCRNIHSDPKNLIESQAHESYSH